MTFWYLWVDYSRPGYWCSQETRRGGGLPAGHCHGRHCEIHPREREGCGGSHRWLIVPNPNPASIRRKPERTVGPAPWYWKTFPAFHSAAGQPFAWMHQGEQGPVGYVVSLALQQEPDQLRLALSTLLPPVPALRPVVSGSGVRRGATFG